MERRKATRGVGMFVRIKEENLAFLKKKASSNELSLSYYMDKLVDSMKAKKRGNSK